MNRLRLVVLLVSSLVMTTAASADVIDTSVCAVLGDPASFDGKMVRIKAATVIAGFDEFLVTSPGCSSGGALWLAYPEGTKAKAGPVAFLQLQLAKNGPSAGATHPKRTPMTLEMSPDFKKFDSLLSTPYKSGGMCLGCVRYTVEATLVGRLDGTNTAGVVRDPSGKFTGLDGFGNLNLYRARLVLQSVSDVTSHEIDYKAQERAAKGGAEKGDAAVHPLSLDEAVGLAERAVAAAAAFGAAGEDNGVIVSNGTANEVPQDESPKGKSDSPDGVLFNVTYDMERLSGDRLGFAIIHMGAHIADLRSAKPVVDLYGLEYRAWETMVHSALTHHQKTLTLPGGIIAMSTAWPAAERMRRSADAISSYLTSWGAIRK